MPSKSADRPDLIEMAKPERQRLSTPKYAISIYDVLSGSKFTFMQCIIIIYGFLSYSMCINHVMLATLGQDSLWQHWPELEANHVVYNSVIAGQAFSRLLGNFYIMPLMDYYGRRDLFLFCNIVPLILTIGSFFAPTFAVYAVFRCLAVCVATTGGIAANVYVIEIVNPRYRPTINWLQQAYSCLGLIYMVGCKYLLERNHQSVWNWLQFYTHLPTLVGVIIGLYTRIEPPGYQVLFHENGAQKAWHTIEKVVGGPDEVDRILREMPLNKIQETDGTTAHPLMSERPENDHLLTTTGDAESPKPGEHEAVRDLVLQEAGGPALAKDNVKFIEEAINIPDKRSVWTFIDVRPVLKGWARLFRRHETRWDTIGLCVIWCGEAFCHWGIMSYCTLFYESVGYDPNLMTMLCWIIQIPLHWFMLKLMTWMNNERLLIGINSAVAVCLTLTLGILMSLKNADIIDGPDIVFAILALSVAITGCIVWGPVYAYSSERYPIKIRASAMGLFNGVDSAALVGSSYLGSAVIAPKTVQYMLYANTLSRLIVAIVTLTLVTTDVADQIFDFDD